MQEQSDINTIPTTAPTGATTTTTTTTILDARLNEYGCRIGQLEAWAGALYRRERDAGFLPDGCAAEQRDAAKKMPIGLSPFC